MFVCDGFSYVYIEVGEARWRSVMQTGREGATKHHHVTSLTAWKISGRAHEDIPSCVLSHGTELNKQMLLLELRDEG